MLTKTDLNQVGKLIRNENRSFRKEVREEFTAVRGEMRGGFEDLSSKLDTTINFLDREHIELKKRVKRIERHLGLPPIS